MKVKRPKPILKPHHQNPDLWTCRTGKSRRSWFQSVGLRTSLHCNDPETCTRPRLNLCRSSAVWQWSEYYLRNHLCQNLKQIFRTVCMKIHITPGFNRTFSTGAACQQRTLTPPDTWSCPTLGLASVLMLRPITPEFVLFRTFELRTSFSTSVLLISPKQRISIRPYQSMMLCIAKGGYIVVKWWAYVLCNRSWVRVNVL